MSRFELIQRVLEARRGARFNRQSPAWMKGAETRARNAAQAAADAGLRVMWLDTTGSSPGQVAAELPDLAA